MKKEYIKAEVEIIGLDDEDTVVTNSGQPGPGPGRDCIFLWPQHHGGYYSETYVDSNNSSLDAITSVPDPIDEMTGSDSAAQVDDIIEEATGGAATIIEEAGQVTDNEAVNNELSVANEAAAGSGSVASTID